MDRDALRDLCLTFRGSEETFPFGFETSVFKVKGKMFALSALGRAQLTVSLKCEPLLAEQLRGAHPAVTAGYHLNKRHWNTVALDGSLPDQMIADMVEDSYDLVVSKLSRARQRALGWSGATAAGAGRPVRRCVRSAPDPVTLGPRSGRRRREALRRGARSQYVADRARGFTRLEKRGGSFTSAPQLPRMPAASGTRLMPSITPVSGFCSVTSTVNGSSSR